MITLDEICTWENLLEASRRTRLGRRSSPAIATHEYNLESDLMHLRGQLVAQTYRPGGYHSFYVHDPKRRLISAAPVRDRVVHHALCNLLEPEFDRSFVRESFANRCAMGTHAAVDHCQMLARRFRFALQCDVRQFFPSIDHDILRAILFRKVKEPRARALIDLIIAGGADIGPPPAETIYFPGDDLFAVCRPRGLPIGNLTSQIWANCYLSPFDHFVKRELRCIGYVRYVDDIIFFADDKPTLWKWKAAAEARLASLRLAIHPGAHPRPVTEGLPFLGFIVFPERRRLKSRKATHFARRVRALIATLGERDRRIVGMVKGWMAHASHANTIGLQKSVLKRLGLRRGDFL